MSCGGVQRSYIYVATKTNDMPLVPSRVCCLPFGTEDASFRLTERVTIIPPAPDREATRRCVHIQVPTLLLGFFVTTRPATFDSRSFQTSFRSLIWIFPRGLRQKHPGRRSTLHYFEPAHPSGALVTSGPAVEGTWPILSGLTPEPSTPPTSCCPGWCYDMGLYFSSLPGSLGRVTACT